MDVPFPTEREPNQAFCLVTCRTRHALGPVKATPEKARAAGNLRTRRVPYL